MTDFIPLFPLNLVVFPGEGLNLHIFEPRYRQLIREAEENRVTFGIPAVIDGKMMEYGTEVKLESVAKRYKGGELDVKTRGIGIFKITSFYKSVSNKLYSGADIERLNVGNSHDKSLNIIILGLVTQLFAALKIDKAIPKSNEPFTLYDLAHHVGFSLEQEYEFLCIDDMEERQDFMINHLEQLIPVVKEMERLRKRVQLNGHFKEERPKF